MGSIVSFPHIACPGAAPATSIPLPRPAIRAAALIRLATALLCRPLVRRQLRLLSDRYLRDIGLQRRDVADPLEACARARAWGVHGPISW